MQYLGRLTTALGSTVQSDVSVIWLAMSGHREDSWEGIWKNKK